MFVLFCLACSVTTPVVMMECLEGLMADFKQVVLV